MKIASLLGLESSHILPYFPRICNIVEMYVKYIAKLLKYHIAIIYGINLVKRGREEYKTVQIPKRLADLIEDFIASEPQFPYRSLAEFVIESARLRYFELKREIEERKIKKEKETHEGGK